MALSMIDALAAPVTAVKVEHTYTQTHQSVKDGNATLWGCKRDADGAMFVAKSTGEGDKQKIRYIAAGTVARYLQLLEAAPAPTK
jgi:hypothetical protein